MFPAIVCAKDKIMLRKEKRFDMEQIHPKTTWELATLLVMFRDTVTTFSKRGKILS